MKTLYSGEYYEVMNIKNILENENIETILENEMMASIEPVAITSGGFRALVLKIQDEDYEKATEVINHYKSGKLHVTMEIGKEEFIGKLEEEGYVLNLTLDDNCLYCSNTDTSYLINSFVIEKEMMFLTEGISETIRAVNSPEFNQKEFPEALPRG